MTEKNPPIPENSEFFRHGPRGDEVNRPYLGWLTISRCGDKWRPWIAAMARVEPGVEICARAPDNLTDEEIDAWDAAVADKEDAVEAWRAWGSEQLCTRCEAPTGRCEEDALYADNDEDGAFPLCEECNDGGKDGAK